MSILICSPERPWGVHMLVRNDERCGRCGWSAPGPICDALDETRDAVEAAAAAMAWAEEVGWPLRSRGKALAA